MIVHELASAIKNDVVAGLAGIVSNPTISMELLEQDVIDERLSIIKSYAIKNLIPKKDLYIAIPCITIDCKPLSKCCDSTSYGDEYPHFEIPLLVNDFGDDAISFIGSINREVSFKVYTDKSYKYHKYKMRGKDKPYVFIDTTPNENNMYDGWVFNAPMLERLTVVGIFKDLRQVEDYSCCFEDLNNISFIDAEIKERVIKKKLAYYRSNYIAPQPNDQIPR